MLTRRALLQALLRQGVRSGPVDAQAVVHREPTSLAPDAVTHNWMSFLGPSHNGVSTETPLRRDLPPHLVWELAKGSGYASPAVVGDRLLFIHRLDDEEVVDVTSAMPLPTPLPLPAAAPPPTSKRSGKGLKRFGFLSLIISVANIFGAFGFLNSTCTAVKCTTDATRINWLGIHNIGNEMGWSLSFPTIGIPDYVALGASIAVILYAIIRK